jgi:thioredoxin 1
MKEADRQRVYDTTDEGLRRYTHEQMKVFAKFTSANCAVCEPLAPPFTTFADDEPDDTIRFLRLASEESPVAKKLMQQKVAPFFVSYCQGRILVCATLPSAAEVQGMLKRLREFLPQSS